MTPTLGGSLPAGWPGVKDFVCYPWNPRNTNLLSGYPTGQTGDRGDRTEFYVPFLLPNFREQIKPTHHILFNKALQCRVFTTIAPQFGQTSSKRQIWPSTLKLVLLVLCATTVRPADALHEAPLLDRMLVQHVEVGRKQAEDLCIRKFSWTQTNPALVGSVVE